jgi:hypothetical protein
MVIKIMVSICPEAAVQMWIISECTKLTEEMPDACMNYFCYEVHWSQKFNISAQNVIVWKHMSVIRKQQRKIILDLLDKCVFLYISEQFIHINLI